MNIGSVPVIHSRGESWVWLIWMQHSCYSCWSIPPAADLLQIYRPVHSLNLWTTFPLSVRLKIAVSTTVVQITRAMVPEESEFSCCFCGDGGNGADTHNSMLTPGLHWTEHVPESKSLYLLRYHMFKPTDALFCSAPMLFVLVDQLT